MKKVLYLLFILLVLIRPVCAMSGHVMCYSSGKVIYLGRASFLSYEDGHLFFEEARTKKKVFAFADCIVKI